MIRKIEESDLNNDQEASNRLGLKKDNQAVPGIKSMPIGEGSKRTFTEFMSTVESNDGDGSSGKGREPRSSSNHKKSKNDIKRDGASAGKKKSAAKQKRDEAFKEKKKLEKMSK